jgi:LysM repeat protein
MKQIVLSFAAFFFFQILSAQDVTYVQFNRDCMSQLEYHYSYPNLKGDNSVWAYSVKPNEQEYFIFMTKGEGHYSPELPKGTVFCNNLDFDDAFVASINRGAQQMLVVFQRQSGGYWLMPVVSATMVGRNGSKYWVRAQQSSFQFDTLRLVNEQNLAIEGSPTAAYFSGAKLNNCLMEYSFHCEPVKAGQIRSDFQFIPGIGIVNDRTGLNASQAMENEIQLIGVNGKSFEDFVTEACPKGSGKIAISKYQKSVIYGDAKYEADKEIASIMQNEQNDPSPATYSTAANRFHCTENWEPGTHIVQKGDNLCAIARTYKVTEQQLIKWNKIQNPDRIEICQKIWLKQPTVKAGATTPNKDEKALANHSATETGKTVKTQDVVQVGKSIQNEPENKNLFSKKPNLSNGGYSEKSPNKDDDNPLKPEKASNGFPPRIHTVAPGEFLYKIAKMYSCPEDCLRIANAMPLEGGEPLTIGQELIIPECICTVDGKVIKKSAEPVAKSQPLANKNNPPVEKTPTSATKKTRVNILDETDSPTVYSTEDQYAEPVSPIKQVNSLTEKEPIPSKAISTIDKKNDTPKVPLFKEHHVKQGENLKSIAIKYHVDVFELSQVNGFDPKESLVPGKIILIPIEEQ